MKSLPILFQDEEDLVIMNKPAGILDDLLKALQWDRVCLS